MGIALYDVDRFVDFIGFITSAAGDSLADTAGWCCTQVGWVWLGGVGWGVVWRDNICVYVIVCLYMYVCVDVWQQHSMRVQSMHSHKSH